MVILRLSKYGADTISCVRYKYKGKEVYNIKHGGTEKIKPVSFGISNKTIAGEFTSPREKLEGNNYILVPLSRTEKDEEVFVKDRQGNKLYYIDIDDSMRHLKHSLVFIDGDVATPNITGTYETIAQGVEEVDGTILKTTVIKVTGKVTVGWKGDARVALIENGKISFTYI